MLLSVWRFVFLEWELEAFSCKRRATAGLDLELSKFVRKNGLPTGVAFYFLTCYIPLN
jgi:hypothetical protein